MEAEDAVFRKIEKETAEEAENEGYVGEAEATFDKNQDEPARTDVELINETERSGQDTLKNPHQTCKEQVKGKEEHYTSIGDLR